MTSEIRITLFGKFSVQFRGEQILDHAPSKVQELLAYLLLHRNRAHPREALAELLWGECESMHSRKYLRHALWQLHAGLLAVGRARASRLIHQEPDWVELELDRGMRVDTVAFEEAFDAVRGKPVVSAPDARRVVDAVQFYRGDLLDGRCRSWCVYERDRFRQMYLTLIDKLIGYYAKQGQYDAGVAFGALALRCDRAHERTHRSLMAIHYSFGDRSEALRQYERCATALREELDVAPSRDTQELHAAICNGDAQSAVRRPDRPPSSEPLLVLTGAGATGKPRADIAAHAAGRGRVGKMH